MLILGIETSADDTSVAVVQATGKNLKVRSNAVSSQIKLHAKWGGIVPHLASREHAKNIDHVLRVALREAGTTMEKIDLIAVTAGPGLIGALMIGTLFAKTLAWKYSKPIIGINHMEGHLYSNWLKPVAKSKSQMTNDKLLFPALCLVVSGGHTQLVLMTDYGKYKLLGETLDDAAGEAFDKVARILGLGYPGGPIIAQYAERGNSLAFSLPRPMLKQNNLNFSFSGLKTAVLYLVRDLCQGSTLPLGLQTKRDIAASAQAAIVEVLVSKASRAARQYQVKTIMLAGGVSANTLLRQQLHNVATELGVNYSQPAMAYTTDNAAMIAAAGYYNWISKTKTRPNDRSHSVGRGARLSWQSISADAGWEIF